VGHAKEDEMKLTFVIFDSLFHAGDAMAVCTNRFRVILHKHSEHRACLQFGIKSQY